MHSKFNTAYYTSKSYCNGALNQQNETTLISMQTKFNHEFLFFSFGCNLLLKKLRHLFSYRITYFYKIRSRKSYAVLAS
jgi:hypothetical protein